MRELWEDLCAQEEDTDNDSDHQYVCEYLVAMVAQSKSPYKLLFPQIAGSEK